MKRIFTAIVLFASVNVYAQQDAQFTQNMFNKLAVNPGYAGSSKSICATLLGRHMWNGGQLNGAPKTYILSIDAPVKPLHGGLGLNVMQDEAGFDKSIIANLNYSFRMPLGPGEIGIGISGGIINKSLNANWSAHDGVANDAGIPAQQSTELTYDVGAGIYYNISDQLYFGLSSTHLPTTTLTYNEAVDSALYRMARHYYIMAGYNYAIGGNPMYELRPSVFVKSETSSADVDLNLNFMYNKAVWGGVTYRVNNAIGLLAGFQKDVGNSILRIGYSYDLGMGDIKATNHKGSHEIMLGYCIKMQDKIKPEKHRNVRFL